MKKMFRRNVCALLVASLFITGAFAPLSGVMPRIVSQVCLPTAAHAWTFGLDTIIGLVAGFGGVGAVIAFITGTVGAVSAAALVSALATLGGPFGMLGGIIAVGGIAILAKGIADIGLDGVLKRMANKWKENGMSLTQIEHEIDDLPSALVSDARKSNVKAAVRKNWYK